jgi:hypothetical protein
MKAIGVAAILLIVSACGQVAQRPSTSPVARATASPIATTTPQPTPNTSPTPLFAVLEAKGTANAWTYNTVAIVGLDGYARAKTTFTPMPVPKLGCMGAILPAQAQVAAGKVFFADGKGVVRSLGIDNKVSIAATFPMTTTQQMLSFAISPDGTQVVGTLLTIPNTANLACSGSTSGTWTYDAYAATGPTTNRLVYHLSWTTPPPSLMALTGWDAIGPIGTYPTVWASQGGGPSSTLGVYVRVDSTTLKPGVQLSDPNKCQVWNSVQDGSFVCMANAVMTGGGTANQRVSQPVSVRRASGTEVWHATVIGQNAPFGPYLAPDGQHFAICCNDLDLANSHEVIVGRDGSQVSLAKRFGASGWLDSTTVVGWTGSGMSYVATSSPDRAVSMGFSGLFVGTVRA